MKFNNYIENVKKRLLSAYDLTENKLIGSRVVDLFGAYHLRTERYIATKKAVVYGMENNEYICLFHVPCLDLSQYQEYYQWIVDHVDDLVQPHKEHMSSVVTLAIVSDMEPDEGVKEEIRKSKFHKGYSFGFRGWVDLKVVLYNLEKQSLIANKKGEEGSEVFQQS